MPMEIDDESEVGGPSFSSAQTRYTYTIGVTGQQYSSSTFNTRRDQGRKSSREMEQDYATDVQSG